MSVSMFYSSYTTATFVYNYIMFICLHVPISSSAHKPFPLLKLIRKGKVRQIRCLLTFFYIIPLIKVPALCVPLQAVTIEMMLYSNECFPDLRMILTAAVTEKESIETVNRMTQRIKNLVNGC